MIGRMIMTTIQRCMTATAVAALLLAPALAQVPGSTSSTPGATAATGTPGFIAEQGKEQWLASKNLIGTRVIGPSNETVGSINDLLVDRDGAILAAVIGVGGF